MGFLFIIGGLISLSVAALIYYVHQAFFSTGSWTIAGKVVEIVVFDQTSKDAMGRVIDVTEAQEPMVEFFHLGKTYRFQANVCALSKSLTVGSVVNVVINTEKYPGVAKLAEESSDYQFMMMLCAGLGCVFVLLGVFLLDIRALLSILSNPLSMLWVLGIVVFLLLVGKKLLMMVKGLSLLPKNITEV